MIKDNEYFLAMEEKNKAGQEFPYGAWKAYWAWRNCYQFDNEEFELSDHLWTEEVKDFVETLAAAGIKSFVVTGESTALMRNLHELAAAGCKLDGLCMFKRGKGNGFLDDEEEQREMYGIRFLVGAAE